MMEILKDPDIILKTKEETLDFIRKGEKPTDTVKSIWLCSYLNKMQEDAGGGMVYNSKACERISAENNLPAGGGEAAVLSRLVYYAQQYRDFDRLIEEGWGYLTSALIEEALRTRAKIEVHGFYGNKVCRPAFTGGAYCVFAPRSRTKGYRAGDGVMARIYNNRKNAAKTQLPVIVEATTP